MQQHLPEANAEQRAISAQLSQLIQEKIKENQGAMPFSSFMQQALYAPQLGYYSAGQTKLGAAGDFTTAPEMTPLFGATLARAILPILPEAGGNIIELGAGSGALAISILKELAAQNCPPENYFIVDLSADLIARQRANIAQHAPEFLDKVHWLDHLPDSITGIVLANEVLDAIPCELIRWDENGKPWQIHVIWNKDKQAFDFEGKIINDAALAAAVAALPVQQNYVSEINPAAYALVKTLGEKLKQGALIFLDYGFPRAEFYHAERSRGTLMCHYRHHAHADPFALVGLQDITSHVDFTAIAEAGTSAGLDLIGYLTQAQFLLNAGILDLLQSLPAQSPEYFRAASSLQTLLSPAEMGELFKVMIFGRGVTVHWSACATGDRCFTL